MSIRIATAGMSIYGGEMYSPAMWRSVLEEAKRQGWEPEGTLELRYASNGRLEPSGERHEYPDGYLSTNRRITAEDAAAIATALHRSPDHTARSHAPTFERGDLDIN